MCRTHQGFESGDRLQNRGKSLGCEGRASRCLVPAAGLRLYGASFSMLVSGNLAIIQYRRRDAESV